MSDKNASKQSSSGIRDLVRDATVRLEAAGVDSPEVDAKLLAAELLGVRPIEVLLTRDLPAGFAADYAAWIERRQAREPLQHIVGWAPFGPLELEVGPGVFIPRPETEVLAEWAVGVLALDEHPVVVDLGTGTGALALYIAHMRPDATVYAVEKSPTAREVARRNAKKAGVELSLIKGEMTDPDLLQELRGTVDLVVSNPPYVPESDDLQREIYADPPEAVFSGRDGLEAIRGLVPVAYELLAPSGALGIEHDDDTSQGVLDIVGDHGGFETPETLQDLTGRDRFVVTSKLAQE